MDQPFDIIIGAHSIVHGIKNPLRKEKKLLVTDIGLNRLQEVGFDPKKDTSCKIEKLSANDFHSRAGKVFWSNHFEYKRIPSQALLQASAIPLYDSNWLLQLVQKEKNKRIICLDQVTDIHNAAAILRTASFYKVDALVISAKGSFGLSPGFFRLASGGTEYVHLVQSTNLSRLLTKLQELSVQCFGFSEHAKDSVLTLDKNSPESCCLVMGAEDNGLSHAVERVLPHMIAFKPQGTIQSLNVSVASAIAMDRFFGERA